MRGALGDAYLGRKSGQPPRSPRSSFLRLQNSPSSNGARMSPRSPRSAGCIVLSGLWRVSQAAARRAPPASGPERTPSPLQQPARLPPSSAACPALLRGPYPDAAAWAPGEDRKVPGLWLLEWSPSSLVPGLSSCRLASSAQLSLRSRPTRTLVLEP